MFTKKEDIFHVDKTWGYEKWLVNNELFCGKILFIRKGEWLSWHMHELKKEFLYLNFGSVRFVLSKNADGSNPEERILSVGDGCLVEQFCPHQLEALEDSYVYEFSTTHYDSDSIRLSKSKGDGGPRIVV